MPEESDDAAKAAEDAKAAAEQTKEGEEAKAAAAGKAAEDATTAAEDAEKAAASAKQAEAGPSGEPPKPPEGERPPMPDPATMTKLHETLPESLPKATNEGAGPVPGTLPEDPTQADEPGAAKPGTPGIP